MRSEVDEQLSFSEEVGCRRLLCSSGAMGDLDDS